MATSIRQLGLELDVPVGAVLEGGYALGPLARSVSATLEALGGPAANARPDGAVAVTPLAREAIARLEPWWPALARSA
jgi:acetoin utilization deacetylase AcuC-like enzyme